MFSRSTKTVFLGVSTVFLLVLICLFRLDSSPHNPSVRVAISFPAPPVITSTNILLVISNHSRSPIVYLTYSLQVRSNGNWMNGAPTAGPVVIETLASYQATTCSIALPPQGGAICRAPILCGWGYEPTWRSWIKREIASAFTKGSSGEIWETYINYSPEIQVPR